MANGRRFQSGLGTQFNRRYKEGKQVDTLMLMKVTKVNYKYNTVDLVALKHKEVFENSYANEGKYSAKLPVEFAGRNIAGQPYGQVNPVNVGAIVLVGFVQSDKNSPIILSVYANNDVAEKLARAPFAAADPGDETLAKQTYQKFELYPSLTYDSVDGEGTRVVSFSGKSFVVFDTQPNTNATMVSDGSYGTAYEDLGTSFYADGEVIEPMSPLAPNILMKHQGILDSEGKKDNHQLLIHMASDGTYRMSQMQKGEDWRTLFEMTPDGKVRLRRQGDTIHVGDGFEIGEILINNDGVVSLRNGETDLEVRSDGLYSNGKPLGQSIGGDVDLSDIYDKIDGLGNDIAYANSEIKNINGGLQIINEKTLIIDGNIKELESSVVIMAEIIETKVSSVEVDQMIDDSLQDVNDEIKKAKEDAERANNKIADMANDNRLTPAEKKDLLAEWELILSEYPSYVNQANIFEVNSDAYTAAYDKVKALVEDLLDDMESTDVIDGVKFRNTFKDYYNARTALLTAILKGLKDGITQAMKEAAGAQLDATNALADAAQAQIDAGRANSLINDIASDGKLTPTEKFQLKKEWDIIQKEHPLVIQQAAKYKVDTQDLTLKYTALKNVITPLLADMNTTSIVNGEDLRLRVSEYYASKTKVLKAISDLAQDVMNDYGGRIKVMETSITQTAEKIQLLATRVESTEEGIEAHEARFTVMADEVSTKVTASEVKQQITDELANVSIGGSNLFVIATQTKGWLNRADGTVGNAVDNSVVSNFIKVRPTSPYVASVFNNVGTNTVCLVWYDTNKKYISGDEKADTGEFYLQYKSPANAAYARISYRKANVALMKFETGTKPTDFSYAWDDIKNDQSKLQEYINEVKKLAEDAQTAADNAKDNADHANQQIDEIANDNIVTPSEKAQLLLQWEEILAEYPLNREQATKFNVTVTAYDNAYNALKTYLTPIFAAMDKNSVIVGSTMRTNFKNYYNQRTTLLNRVAEIAKQLADNAQNKADELDGDLNNIGGYNYVGFSSGENGLPRLMIKNVGYHTHANSTSSFTGEAVSLKPINANSQWYFDIGTSNSTVFTSLADFRMREVKAGQWLTGSMNLQVFGTGTAHVKMYTFDGGGWKESQSRTVSSTDGLIRVVVQRKVLANTTGVLLRVYTNATGLTEIQFNKVQLEVGIRATPWKKSDIDVTEDINNIAKEYADVAIKAAEDAMTAAKNSQTSANSANQKIADMSNDNIVTPTEKLDLKKEWEIIVAEKPKNDSQADKFGVSKVDYGAKYTALQTYLTPILANMAVNSTIVGQTMRNTFKAYYTARTDLLNAIATKAKALADAAQNDVNGLHTVKAWANSADGTKDFTRVYPNENLAGSDTIKPWGDIAASPVVITPEKITITSVGTAGIGVYINDFSIIKPSTTYTLTYKFKVTSGLVNAIGGHISNTTWGAQVGNTFKINGATVTGGYMSGTGYAFVNGTTYTISLTVKTVANIDKANTTPGIYIQPNRAAYAKAYTAEITEVKLEEGATATPFVPAVSDDPERAKMKYLGLGIRPSDKPSDYTWTLIGDTALKTAWANSADGRTDFTTTPTNPNVLPRSIIATANAGFSGYDASTYTYTVTGAAGAGGTYGCGLKTTGTTIRVPWGKRAVTSFEVYTSRALNWNADVNCYPVSGTAWSGNDNDSAAHRTTSAKAVPANVWTKCWYSFANLDSRNTGKVDLYDQSNFGLVMTAQTTNHTFKFRKVKTEIVDATASPTSFPTAFVANASENLADSKMKYVGTSPIGGTNPANYTWMLNSEYVESQADEKINGKEGSWIYQPTTPSNPSIGLVWVDTTKTPYQPKRYTGTEHGWVPLTPEEVSDLPWGEDGSTLADWVAQAEQKITATSIISTVLGSQDFTTIFDQKANSEDLANMSTIDDLNALREEYQRLIAEGIDGIDFTPYVTQSELEQLKESFTFTIQQAGGVNMIRNSLGYQGTSFWNDGQNENYMLNSNFDIGNGLSFWKTNPPMTAPTVTIDGGMNMVRWQGTTAERWKGLSQHGQDIQVSNGDKITISFYGKRFGSDATPFILGVHWRDRDGKNAAQSWSDNLASSTAWTRIKYTFTCPDVDVHAINVMIYAQDYTNFDLGVARVKLEYGDKMTEWTPAPRDYSELQWVGQVANQDLANLGFGSGFLFDNRVNAFLKQPVQLPEARTGMKYGFSFYMNVTDTSETVKCGARIYEAGSLKHTLGVENPAAGIPVGYHRYALVFEPDAADVTVELFVESGATATVVISGVMLNIGDLALKWQPFPSEIYNTNVQIDINGITVKNNQTDGYTLITPQEFSGYAKVDNVMERIFTLNGQVTEVKMLQAEERITMEPISIFAMNTDMNKGWAFVSAIE